MMRTNSTAYLCGPMRGYPIMNFKNFFFWQVMLEKSGYEVLNPCAFDCEKALYTEWYFTDDKYDEVIEKDKKLIREKADWLFVLKGWEDSKGANEEIAEAEKHGIPVYYEDKRRK